MNIEEKEKQLDYERSVVSAYGHDKCVVCQQNIKQIEKELATLRTNLIELKEQEITNYKRLIHEYNSGRWMSMYRRHLDKLCEELAELKSQSNPDN